MKKKDLKSIAMIAKERKRQIEKLDYDKEHDDDHSNGELAWAAACYAAPDPIYAEESHISGSVLCSRRYFDPFPHDWEDKRRAIMDLMNVRASRIALLVKAGALIAAEIDRLLRLEKAGL